MCQYFGEDEMRECVGDPFFCGVCLTNRVDVGVVDHVCEDCRR